MGQRVIFSSKLKEKKTVGVVKTNLNKVKKLLDLYPKPSELIMNRLKYVF